MLFYLRKGGKYLIILHLSDLHLGRRFHDVSLLEDQRYILEQILELLDSNGADAVVVAGDLYDKPVPPAEAVQLLDWFLTQLSRRSLPVLLVSGNHDSQERIAFGTDLLPSSGIHVSPVFEGPAEPVILRDQYGPVCFYLLPFIKPIHVRRAFPDREILTYTDAVQTVVEAWQPDSACRNVLVAHQLVTGGLRSDSETVSIGGLDDVSVSALEGFDYVALGHLHRAQSVHSDRIRYCGAPLAYAFSEGGREKSVTWVELGEKGQVQVTETLLKPLRGTETLRGTLETLMQQSTEDYVRIILTDEEDVSNAMARLRSRYPNLLRLEYDNPRTRAALELPQTQEQSLSPLELLEQFYEQRNSRPMSPDQRQLAKAWMEEIWEEEP